MNFYEVKSNNYFIVYRKQKKKMRRSLFIYLRLELKILDGL